MAACDPAAAVWVTDGRAAAHDRLAALHDPLAGPQCIEQTYSDNTAPNRFSFDTDGLTEMPTLGSLNRDDAAQL